MRVVGRHAETLSTVDMLWQLSAVIALVKFEHLFSLSSQKLIVIMKMIWKLKSSCVKSD